MNKELAAPFLRDLSARVGETVNMAVRDGMDLRDLRGRKVPELQKTADAISTAVKLRAPRSLDGSVERAFGAL